MSYQDDLRRAAESGDANAQAKLGVLLYRSDGKIHDPVQLSPGFVKRPNKVMIAPNSY